jgi:hypothetical protein
MSNPLSRFLNSASVRHFFNRQITSKNIEKFYVDRGGECTFNIKNVTNSREVAATLKLAYKYQASHSGEAMTMMSKKEKKLTTAVKTFLADYESSVADMLLSIKTQREEQLDIDNVNKLIEYLKTQGVKPALFINKINKIPLTLKRKGKVQTKASPIVA